jgi:hypothetical protein
MMPLALANINLVLVLVLVHLTASFVGGGHPGPFFFLRAGMG